MCRIWRLSIIWRFTIRPGFICTLFDQFIVILWSADVGVNRKCRTHPNSITDHITPQSFHEAPFRSRFCWWSFPDMYEIKCLSNRSIDFVAKSLLQATPRELMFNVFSVEFASQFAYSSTFSVHFCKMTENSINTGYAAKSVIKYPFRKPRWMTF